MSRRNEVEIALSLQDRMSPDLKRAGDNLKRFERTVRDNIFIIGATVGATLGLVRGFQGLTDAAREQINSERVLAGVINNTGASYKDYEAQIKETTAALQAKTNFGDEEQLRVLARVVAITGDVNRAMEVLPVLLDASAVSGQALTTISNTLTRALTGEVNQARSLGITFDATADFGERLKIVQEAVGGAAQANVDPFTQMQNTLGDISEEIGRKLIPKVEEAADVFDVLADKAFEFINGPVDELDKRAQEVAERGLDALMQEMQRVDAEIERISGDSLPSLLVGLKENHINVFAYNDALRDLRLELLALQEQYQRLQEEQDDQVTITRTFIPLTEKEMEALNKSAAANDELGQAIANNNAIRDEELRQLQERLQLYIDGNTARMIEIGQWETLEQTQKRIQDLAFEQWLLDVDAGIDQLFNDIVVLNPEVKRQNEFLEAATRIYSKYKNNLINAAEAQSAFEGILKLITDEIKSQNAVLLEQNRIIEEQIRLKERLTGQQLTQPGGFTGTVAQLQSAFAGIIANVVNAGGTQIDANTVETASGRIISFANFMALVEQLARQGSDSPIIDAIRQLQQMFNFQTRQGEFKVVPGGMNTAVPVMAHGGEVFGRPGPGGFGGTVHFHFEGSFIGNSHEFQRMVAHAQRAYLQRGGGRG